MASGLAGSLHGTFRSRDTKFEFQIRSRLFGSARPRRHKNVEYVKFIPTTRGEVGPIPASGRLDPLRDLRGSTVSWAQAGLTQKSSLMRHAEYMCVRVGSPRLIVGKFCRRFRAGFRKSSRWGFPAGFPVRFLVGFPGTGLREWTPLRSSARLSSSKYEPDWDLVSVL